MDELEGEELGVALEELRRAARVNLPRLASEYSDVANLINGLEGIGQQCFTRPAYFQDNGFFGPLYDKWTDLQRMLGYSFGRTTNNYNAVSDLLNLAIQAFSDADQEAADALEVLRDEVQGGDPIDDEFTADIPNHPEISEYEDFQKQNPGMT